MIRFQIPKAYLPGFETLMTLTNEQVADLTAFLENIQIGTGIQSFGKLFEERFGNEPSFQQGLAGTLYSLGSFRLNPSTIDLKDRVASLARSFADQVKKDYDEKAIIRLEEVLSRLLDSATNLTITFKAFQLLSENESVFRDNHIITDIRLLFKEELGNKERHGLVTHKLKIQAEDSGDQNDYFFSLTFSDLQKLQEQITRAMDKEKLIREDYKETMSFINITE